ncbi:MAG: TenA family protein [Bacteroidota bacterium]
MTENEKMVSKTTELLRDEAREAWESITTDPWTVALAEGRLERAAMVRYLVQDHRFLDAFSVLLSAMLAHTKRLEDRVFGSQFLALILSKENTYFERSFEALAVSAEERSVPDAAATTKFDELMRSTAASGKLHAMLAVLVVCEWSYETWGERAARTKAKDLPFYYAEWIDLHSGPYFRQVVAYLRGLLDDLPLSPAELEDTRRAFHAAVHCEQAFWDTVANNDG